MKTEVLKITDVEAKSIEVKQAGALLHDGALVAIPTETVYGQAANALDENALHEMIKKTIKDHKRIVFNGNGYDDSWIKEAVEKRGLLNYRTTPDCMPRLLDKKTSIC